MLLKQLAGRLYFSTGAGCLSRMSGETEANVSGWSVDTLRVHLLALIVETEKRLAAENAAAELRNEQRFNAQQQAIKDALTSQKEAVAAALVAAEKAVLVAETNAEKWRGAANEWRGAMNDRERTLMPRAEAEATSRSNSDKIDALASRIDKNEGRTGGLLTIFSIIAAVGVLVAIFMALKR